MTNTNERERARPVEGLARAMSSSKAWPAVFAPGSATTLASAALAYLVSHGFLNEQYFEARKAEEKAAESPEKRGLSTPN